MIHPDGAGRKTYLHRVPAAGVLINSANQRPICLFALQTDSRIPYSSCKLAAGFLIRVRNSWPSRSRGSLSEGLEEFLQGFHLISGR